MPVRAGYVIDVRDAPAARDAGDTVTRRVTIDRSSGCELLEQRVEEYDPGRSLPRRLHDRHEVLYVVAGRGTIAINGREDSLEPNAGVFVAAGDEYVVDAQEPLTIVAVSAPAEHAARPEDGRRVVRYADQPRLPATPNREFRYLVNEAIGCPDVTQFIGVIPPGNAGMHSHTYDEVVYVIEGKGVLHLGGETTPLEPGTCIHLPPLEEHCLENVGSTPMRVLGVFHPSGDPASRAWEEGKHGNNERGSSS